MQTSKSPFFSRTYGGYSADQIRFIADHSADLYDATVLDPMAGQGFFLSQGLPEASDVWLGDINPGPLLLATLRDPKLIGRAQEFKEWYLDKLSCIFPGRSRGADASYSEDWLSECSRSELSNYSAAFDVNNLSAVWRAPARVRLAIGLAVLAAREVICYTESDNVTWFKKGGLQHYPSVREPLLHAVDQWIDFAAGAALKRPRKFRLHIAPMNPERHRFGPCPQVDLVITSPPYANRLDYTRMWAPELQLLGAMLDFDPDSIKRDQIGTTVVHSKWPEDDRVAQLPTFIRRTLDSIRKDKTAASERYYYPFFANYALNLSDALQNIGDKVRRRGRMLVFVRDTTRKDFLLEVGRLVESALKASGFRQVGKHQKVVRHHVGMMRRASPATVYGLAQREWWLAFEKI
ncbi:MAG TPA: hypothetical protein VGQ49_15200 [Bryobacteraceae bacterium]|jgi:hypothetical protein|nr:hypothetical protein [Bryobacteraceae bacterium]